jgi:translocation and assembly module TamB
MTTNSGSDLPNAPTQPRGLVVRRILVRAAWIAGGAVTAAILVVLLFVALINVDGVHRYLLGLAQRKAASAIGVPVHLENFKVNIPALRVDLYGLKVDGAAPYRTPPLLQVNHIDASIRIVSIFHFKWYLNQIEVDHPVAWIVEGAHGESNIPVPHGGNGKSNVNLFSLAIRHAIVDRGELYFNDHAQNMTADLTDLDLRVAYNTLENAYNGGLTYKNGNIQMGAIQPVPHSLEASFSLHPEAFLLHRAKLTLGKSTIVIAGNVQNFDRPEVRARYEANIDGAEIGHILRSQSVPSGAMEASGKVAYQSTPTKPFLETLTVNGEASSRALELATQGRILPITHVSANYSLNDGVARLTSLNADLLGGKISAQGEERATGNHQSGKMRAEIRGISLQDAQHILPSSSPRTVNVSGTLNGTAVAAWGATFKDLVARIDAGGQGRVTQRTKGAGPSESAPFSGEVHGSYTQENGQLKLANTSFHTPATSLVLNGTAGKSSSIAVRFQSNDLHELASFGSLFVNRQQARSIDSLDVAGQGSFQGNISGSITAPQVTGYLEATHLRFNGSGWKAFHASVRLSPSIVRIENAYLAPESQGSIQLSANARLNHWSLDKFGAIAAELNASQLRISDLRQAVKQTAPVNGKLNAVLHLRGSIANPEGSGRIQLTDATAYDQPIRSATATLSTKRNEVTGEAAIEVAGGQVKARATVNPVQKTYSGEVTSTGIHIEQFEALKASNAAAHGTVTIHARGNGTFDNPAMQGNIKVSNASIQGHDLSESDLQVNLANRVVTANISSNMAHAPLQGHARVALTGSYLADVSLDTQTLPLQSLLALYAPDMADEITGQTQVHLEMHGPLKDKQAMTGKVTIPILNVTYNNAVKVAAAGPIHIDYQGGNLHVQPMSIQGTDTNLQLQGTIPIYGKAPFSVQAQGSVNLQIAQVFSPELRSAGMARIDIHSDNLSNGGLAGQVEITGASFSYGDVPIGLSNGNGVLTLNGNRIDISKFNGNIGGGTVTAQGGVALRPNLSFDVGMTATNVRMIYPQGMWENVDANLRLTGSTDRALMGGSVGIADISFTPAFDLTSMIGQFSSGVAAPTSPGFSQNLFLNIAVHSTNVLNPSSRTMSVAGTAALTIRGTAAHPAVIGRVNLTGGSMIFNGKRFVLTGGTVQFVNPNEIRPVLNVSLTTTIQQYDINLRFTGPADQLRTDFTSNPSLPRADVISLLAFGTTTEAQAANATSANQTAESAIASGVSSQVTSRISKIAGISQLSISPVLTSGTSAGPPGAVITIRQQVTGNLFITFSTNVASTQDQTFQGQYRLSPRVSVSATRDPNGGFAVDTLIKKTW